MARHRPAAARARPTSRWQRVWRALVELTRRWQAPVPVPEPLWQEVLARYPFIAARPASERERLRGLCQQFLARKEFHGTLGLQITDHMALCVAAQACLPLLHWGPGALRWYDDFVGIVIHPDEVVAHREVMDEAGVVHHYDEPLAGEAMAGGPVMLVWRHVRGHAEDGRLGHSLVIHEFAHKIDMRHKPRHADADGCPRLPAGFLGLGARAAHALWANTLQDEYRQFRNAVEMAERFGAEPPWLDAYGAHSPAEFFAVACEAYFVNRPRFEAEFPRLARLFDGFFQPPPLTGAATP